MSLRFTLLVSLLLVGCVGGLDNDDEILGWTEQGVTHCPNWMCGSGNSPEIDHRGLHELNMDGSANAEGFQVTGFKMGNTEYKLDVQSAEFIARDSVTDAAVFIGAGVVGARMTVKHSTGMEYTISIEATATMNYWAKPNHATKTTRTYLVKWIESKHAGNPPNEWKNICSNPPADNTDTLGMDTFHVVVFETDRVDAQRKTVKIIDEKTDKRWFSIGCAGHALAKLHLAGHTQGAMNATAASADRFVTTTNERQMFLKMITADYCGTGEAFTIAGQPLTWRDDRGWMDYTTAHPKVEAHWNEKGAVCLNTPRVVANPTPLIPDVEASIAASCKRPPTCPATGGAHIESANP